MELPVSADAASTLKVKQVEGGVTITPSYSISDNLFENNLDWLINSGIQGTVGQLVLGGAIVAIAGPIFTGVSDLDSFNFALGEFAPTFDNPIRIPAHDHFNLGGFGESRRGQRPVGLGESSRPNPNRHGASDRRHHPRHHADARRGRADRDGHRISAVHADAHGNPAALPRRLRRRPLREHQRARAGREHRLRKLTGLRMPGGGPEPGRPSHRRRGSSRA